MPVAKFSHPSAAEPGFIPGEHVVTFVTVWPRGSHDVVNIWNRGGHAGELTVASGDGEGIARLLLPPPPPAVPVVRVLSRSRAERYVPESTGEVCISITTPGHEPAHLSDRFADVLRRLPPAVSRLHGRVADSGAGTGEGRAGRGLLPRRRVGGASLRPEACQRPCVRGALRRGLAGIQPPRPRDRGGRRCWSCGLKWARRGSNPRPSVCKTDALTN